MPSIRKYTILLFVISCCFECNAQLASESNSLERPFLAFTKMCSWTDIFEQSVDVEVTARFGGENDLANGSSFETVFRCRLIQDRPAKIIYSAWALGGTEIEVRSSGDGSLNDVRDGGVRFLENDVITEAKFAGGLAVPKSPCEKQCWDRVTLIDFKRAVCDPSMFTLRSDKKKNLDILTERLATLRGEQLETSEERHHGKKVLVHRVKAEVSSDSHPIPVHRIVVSDTGFDKGLVTEFDLGFMKKGDKAKYTSESQREDRYGVYTTAIVWKSLVLSDGKDKREVVLPISVAKKRKVAAAKHESYFNAQLKWSNPSSESKKLLSVDACRDLTNDFMKAIDSALGR